jgi:hypothetical protein
MRVGLEEVAQLGNEATLMLMAVFVLRVVMLVMAVILMVVFMAVPAAVVLHAGMFPRGAETRNA